MSSLGFHSGSILGPLLFLLYMNLVEVKVTCQQNIFVKEFFHVWNELDPQLGRQDVSGSDEELFPQMGNLVRTDRQQREHSLHHQAAVSAYDL